MYNCGMLKFRKISSISNGGFGNLTPIEFPTEIPFEIKRIYYIYDVNGNEKRGNHSHKKLHQVLICVNGNVKVKLTNHFDEKEFILDDPSVGLYVGPDNWREMYDFSEGAVLLVLASNEYDEEDYIRDYDEFIEHNRKKFGDK